MDTLKEIKRAEKAMNEALKEIEKKHKKNAKTIEVSKSLPASSPGVI